MVVDTLFLYDTLPSLTALLVHLGGFGFVKSIQHYGELGRTIVRTTVQSLVRGTSFVRRFVGGQDGALLLSCGTFE